jgi:UDP-glucose 4-epimerase
MILVTGGAGFIGKNLIPRFDLSEVVVVDNLQNNSTFDDMPQVKIFEEDYQVLPSDAFENIDTIVHLAAETGIERSVVDPVGSTRQNVLGLVSLLDKARLMGVKNFIFASTGSVVGRQTPPFDESLHMMPSSPYSASKAAGELFCKAYSDTYGIRTISLRFSNIYGPFFKNKWFNLIPQLIINAFAGNKTVIYGDGKQVRDYMYADDLAEFIYRTVNLCKADKLDSGVYQLGTGKGFTVFEVINVMQNILDDYGKKIWIEFDKERKGEIKANFTRPNKAFVTFGFAPNHDLDSGLRKTIEWYAREQK